MAAIQRFWVVRDASPQSELGDILFEAASLNDFASYCIGTGLADFKRENHTIYTSKSEATKDAEARLARADRVSTAAVRVAARYAASVNPRQEAKRDVKPVNAPKGIDKGIVRENGKADTDHLEGDDGSTPARRDIRPEDVFLAKPKDTAVRSLVETGHDMEKVIEKQIPKDRGYDAVKNLSQYLIETEGGGGAKAVGLK
jgi:hypothetical protein